MKKYTDIERLKEKYCSAFVPGENITITEKIDGANASIVYNPEKDCIEAFSRRQKLSEDQGLNGFYDFVQTLDKFIIQSATDNGRYIIFGEWLIKHTVKYPEDKMNQFYVFDLYDTQIEQYAPWEKTKMVAEFIGLKTVPLFFDGKFESWDKVYEYLGKSEMNAEPTGEGIVIKSQDRLDNKSSKTPAYVKIVTKEFSEVHQSKPHNVDPEKLAKKQQMFDLVGSIVTERRVEKTIQKFIEDNVIPADWDEHDLKTIAKILPKAVYEDCVKEEPETVEQIENFGKYCAGVAMQHARNLIK